MSSLREHLIGFLTLSVKDKLSLETKPEWTKFDYALMDTAYRWASLSHANRKKVGCVFSKDNRPLITSYNGMPSFLDNECEDLEGKTKPNLIHAEHNGIIFAAREGISLKGSTVYITCTPCSHCAGTLGVLGVNRIIFHEDYVSKSRTTDFHIFEKAGIEVIKFNEYR